MKQEINFVQCEPIPLLVTVKDAFEVRKDRPLIWLQRLCAWVMAKLGSYSLQEKVTYHRHIFYAEDFAEQLFKQKLNIEEVFHQDPTHVLIGGEDYEKLMEMPRVQQMFSFYINNAARDERRIYGLKVTVVPWMRGVLVMPS